MNKGLSDPAGWPQLAGQESDHSSSPHRMRRRHAEVLPNQGAQLVPYVCYRSSGEVDQCGENMADWGRKAIREIPPSCGQQHARRDRDREQALTQLHSSRLCETNIYIYISNTYIYVEQPYHPMPVRGESETRSCVFKLDRVVAARPTLHFILISPTFHQPI